MKKSILILIIIFGFVANCSSNVEEDESNNPSFEILRAIKSNISEEEYNYKISAVREGIKLWNNNIKVDYTTSNDSPFLIYFTNKDCALLPDYELLPTCLKGAKNNSLGITFPYLKDNSIVIKNATIILFNEYFTLDSDFNDITKIISHEVGHVYGLEHNTEYRNIMYPDLSGTEIPDNQYVSILNQAISVKNIPGEYTNKFYLSPPKTDVVFHIQTVSAKTK